VSDETVRLHLDLRGKAYTLNKRVTHTMLDVNKDQRVTSCLSFLSRHSNTVIFDQELTSDEKWVLYETPKHARH